MTADDIVGTWRLLSWVTRAGDGSVSYPFGEDTVGYILYTPGGHMFVQLCPAHRSPMTTADPLGGPEAERAAAYSSYIAYGGTYRLEGDVVVHDVGLSLFPNWAGAAQRRYAQLSPDGTDLVLRTDPLEVAGRLVTNELHWRRET